MMIKREEELAEQTSTSSTGATLKALQAMDGSFLPRNTLIRG